MSLKLAFLIDHMGIGGAQELLATYLEHSVLVRSAEVHLIQVRQDNVFASRIGALPCVHTVIDQGCTSYRCALNPRNFFRLYRLLSRIKPDYLHAQMFVSLVYGIPAARLAGVSHTTYGVNYLRKQVPFWWCYIMQAYAPLLTRFFVYHDTVHKSFGLPLTACQTLPGGMDFTGKSKSAVPDSAGLDEMFGSQCIASVGRLVKSKGHDLAIRAVASLRDRYPQLKLVIVGAGPFERVLRGMVRRLDLDETVLFVGFVDNLGCLLRQMKLFVSASIDEVTNTAAQWALHSGIPVVKFRIPDVVENIDLEDCNCGLYAKHRSVTDLALKIGLLLSNVEQRIEMGRNGRLYVERITNPTAGSEAFDRAIVEAMKSIRSG